MALFKMKVAAVPLNFTEVAPVKFVPVIVIEFPTSPLAGLKLVTPGGGVTLMVKLAEELAVPFGVVTAILPVLAPEGTLVAI